MNQNELYKTLAVETPRPEIVETPKPEVAVVKPQKSITDEEAGFELDNLGTSLLERFEKLSSGTDRGLSDCGISAANCVYNSLILFIYILYH